MKKLRLPINAIDEAVHVGVEASGEEALDALPGRALAAPRPRPGPRHTRRPLPGAAAAGAGTQHALPVRF